MFDFLFFVFFPIQLPFNENCPSRYVDQLDHLSIFRYPILDFYGNKWKEKKGCNHYECEDEEWVIYAGENTCLVSFNIEVDGVYESIPMFYIDGEKYVYPIENRTNYEIPQELIWNHRRLTCTEPKLIGVPLGARLFGSGYGVMFSIHDDCPEPYLSGT